MDFVTDEQVRSALQLLDSSLYAVIATVNEDGSPWNSPVFFCQDGQLVLYWASALASRHSQNILRNNKVHVVIFNSHLSWGHGKGIYLNALASVVENRGKIESIRRLRIQKAAAA